MSIASVQSTPVERQPDEAPLYGISSLIDELLSEQGSLQTPVAKFSDYHDREPDLAPHYRQLIPLEKPGKGEQYAFEVALDRCTGCKACVSACHSLNGLDEDESWRDVGAMVGGDAAPGWQQTVTSACHHCEDPGCLNGCPVGAYEKEKDTGIVRHLDDQCIGCSYCILTCPYDVPKYSKKRGIVRKCDMCHQRLTEGEAPACVQACPTEAIRIVTVKTGEAPQAESVFMEGQGDRSGLPESDITLPTTRYTGRRLPATAYAADRDALVAQHSHWPLVLMLVLTQSGLGVLLATCLQPAAEVAFSFVGVTLFMAGMVSAVFHLGQPLKAWRFFLGLRTSWLSREILAFSVLLPLPLLWIGFNFIPDFPLKDSLFTAVRLLMPSLALVAVFTSVMIYHDTKRTLWRIDRTSFRFFGTLLLMGVIVLNQPWIFSILMTAKLAWEYSFLRLRTQKSWSPDGHSSRLMAGPLRSACMLRGAVALCAVGASFISPWPAIFLLLGAELLERMIFFRAVSAPKMPGNFGPRSAQA
ncbi:MAG TPA: molybdopterin oxidoreductase [Verrucomicrobiales bacterium]|nr:molybdopterin oxidoreductase [Verrucomicrobiales bacterium]